MFLPLFLVALMAGCSSDTSTRSGDDTAVRTGVPPSEFEPLAFRTGEPGSAPAGKILGTGSSVTARISAEQGGQLLLDWEKKNSEGVTGVKVKVEVKFHPGALDEDRDVTISLVNPAYAMLNVELEFGNHGTRFKIPAEVKLDIEGLDLKGAAGVDGSSGDAGYVFDFYWFDPAEKAWFAVPKDEDQYEVDLKDGKIKGIWYFDHFSRYSLSRGYYENCCWGYIPY